MWNAIRLIKRKRCCTHPFNLIARDLRYDDNSMTMVVKQDLPLDLDAPKSGLVLAHTNQGAPSYRVQ